MLKVVVPTAVAAIEVVTAISVGGSEAITAVVVALVGVSKCIAKIVTSGASAVVVAAAATVATAATAVNSAAAATTAVATIAPLNHKLTSTGRSSVAHIMKLLFDRIVTCKALDP